MIRKKTSNLPAVHASSLLFICALLPALLFKGPQIEFFAVTQIVLVIWLGWIFMHSHESGLRIPKTALALCLTLFWLWLALSIAWSLAPSISVINFWWVGSLVLVFWLYILTPNRDALWSHVAAILLVIGTVLALMGIYQVLVLEQHARSVFETRNTHAAFLNLVALPASAYFLRMNLGKEITRHQIVMLGAVLFVLFLSIFLTASRGATLSLAISLSLLAALTMRYVPKRAVFLLFGLLVLAYLVTKISHGELGARLPQLVQDSARRIIWESSWNLLQASPWQGIGLGLFYLAYPAYRNPLDSSGGFFAHNDYLQIWIETGLPGLILLLSILVAATWLFARAVRKTNMSGDTRIEMTGLFCGLLAVAGHSVVDFNLYILSIMMTSGLVMARFHELATRGLKVSSWHLRPSRFVGKQAYPLIVVLLVLLPVLYFIALGMANSYYDKALSLAREGKLQEADKSLANAQHLTSSDDRMLIAHADLYRHAIALLPPGPDDGKKSLYDDAVRFLDRAQQANSLRGLTFVIRGRLYQQNPALAGENMHELAAESFQRALALNPRLFQGRMDYVSLLLQAGKKEEALQSLDEGVKHDYFNGPELIPFYSLTAKLRREAGRLEEAGILEDRVRELEKMTTAGYYLRGY
ncbi:MAG: O-antigen ligase family protein [Sulfuricaulis sp.]|uniref:O-antigen ligase family protein n=1 Tax=Sulfuricaulis sp. TaxID=2003553 RepID=UPI0025DD0BB6|nr:O-antigen ligase family protein [Sulfuricaulis sp.]MCR4347465.1 O-antigen ligase family protein [Sulfuricaulis sp.]